MKKLIPVISLGMVMSVQANPDVASREYKLMLQSQQFTYGAEASNVSSFLQQAEAAIESAISRDVIGSEYLAKVRDVKFFDTPGSCELDRLGYAFRERVENGESEVTLKFRSPDRYIADFEDLSASGSQAETKLEEDIGISPDSGFKVIYGHSTTIPNTRNINEMKDINSLFPGFDQEYGFNNSLDLAVVGDLNIHERVYKGRVIDLGQFDAEISVTLWYKGAPTGTEHPLVAEVSFKYEDSSADYTQKVVSRAKLAFEALQELGTWTDPESKTKTRFVYEYAADFCGN
ncbi:hypothetical protein BTA51_04105 [Hahella sp. CCB-MM4]|uniref:hypothetical protein n=1 Tax=Hahella sp. (strain CCB-MM4) TaxID=1926491 RepID=UPI000B9BD19A|nr:hypothetical protein [Hahella sp. CCB-MM4]OZG74209.1 hypothetical protein BTA51_04105 [Hahella sp. CCB-MM4]